MGVQVRDSGGRASGTNGLGGCEPLGPREGGGGGGELFLKTLQRFFSLVKPFVYSYMHVYNLL
jgi:hypothetical protein